MAALLEVKDLEVRYAIQRGFFKREDLRAVRGVSFELSPNETWRKWLRKKFVGTRGDSLARACCRPSAV
jgi:ABC-type antimicrobial peptide transport system ATPase subunit